MLQRVLGGGPGPVSPMMSPHSPGYPGYYDTTGVVRPMSHVQYNTPPPNMLHSPGQYNTQPPRIMPADARRPPVGPGPGKVDMNGVERLAVDMMSMGMPPQSQV